MHIVKTLGIILRATKYKESSLIVKIFSLDFGTIDCIVNGIRTSKKNKQGAIFEPLTQVYVVLYQGKGSLKRIKEISMRGIALRSPSPLQALAILFLSEICYKALFDKPVDEKVFHFLIEKLKGISCHTGACNQSLVLELLILLLGFSHLLGFGLQAPEELDRQLIRNNYPKLTPQSRSLLRMALNDQYAPTKTDTAAIFQALFSMVNFYRIHITGLRKVSSLALLEELYPKGLKLKERSAGVLT